MQLTGLQNQAITRLWIIDHNFVDAFTSHKEKLLLIFQTSKSCLRNFFIIKIIFQCKYSKHDSLN